MRLRRVASVSLIAVVAVAAGCGGGDGATTTQGGPGPDRLAKGEVGEVQRQLSRLGYSVEVIDSSELPRRQADVSRARRRRSDLPPAARPTGGLRVNLHGDGRVLVYVFSSQDLAFAMAPAFMGDRWGNRGVFGCGRAIYFARGSKTDRWVNDVQGAWRRVSDCSRAVAVIS